MNRRKWRPRPGEVVELRRCTASPYVVIERRGVVCLVETFMASGPVALVDLVLLSPHGAPRIPQCRCRRCLRRA